MRRFVLFLVVGAVVLATDQGQVIRGHLRQPAGKPPVIETSDGKQYTVSGDQFTRAQMADPKLKDREMELEGRIASPGHFEATKIFTLKDGKRHKATYWCDICSIRTHMPGRCMCCQADTELQEIPAP
jgi:hypothetical protein